MTWIPARQLAHPIIAWNKILFYLTPRCNQSQAALLSGTPQRRLSNPAMIEPNGARDRSAHAGRSA
jgi:hypothetical protein